MTGSPTAGQLAFCRTLASGARQILGGKLHSFYIYGAMMFPRPAGWRVDVDFHVIASGYLTDIERENIRVLHERMARQDPLGGDLDGYYVLLADAKRRESPEHLVWPDVIDFAWPLHRAHLHAGKFQLLYGEDPRRFVPQPSWPDCAAGLDNELQFVKKHPEHPQFGMLNLSRLLYSWKTRDVVTSKYQSAQWALRALDTTWHPALRAALRDYEGRPRPGDLKLLSSTFPGYLEFCDSEIGKSREEAGLS